MQVIDRSLQPSQYWPGLYALFGMDYDRLAPVYTNFYATKTSQKAFEEFMTERAGLGLAVQQPELEPVQFDTPNEGYRTQVTHASYGLAVAISREAEDDNLYEDVGGRMMKELAFSARQTEEYIAHAPLRAADIGQADFQLLIDVRYFRIAADAEPAAEIGLSARLVDKEGKVTASRLFEGSERLDKIEPAAAVAAFNEAFGRIAKEMIAWTLKAQ